MSPLHEVMLVVLVIWAGLADQAPGCPDCGWREQREVPAKG